MDPVAKRTGRLRAVAGRVRRALGGGPRVYTSYGEVERAEYAFYLRYLRPGMTVLDVGANVGELTILFSRFVGPRGRVYAFEPSGSTFERLRRVCEAAAPEVSLENVAVGDRDGTATLYDHGERYSELNSLADRPLHQHGIHTEPVAESVPLLRLDTFCEARGVERVDLLKVDVEGAELQVLQGARRLLSEKRVRCVIFEFGQTTFDMGNSPAAIRRYLRDTGYRVRNLVKGDPAFPGGSRVETAQFSMHIAEPS
jgi:FkbM family methyltransferase